MVIKFLQMLRGKKENSVYILSIIYYKYCHISIISFGVKCTCTSPQHRLKVQALSIKSTHLFYCSRHHIRICFQNILHLLLLMW